MTASSGSLGEGAAFVGELLTGGIATGLATLALAGVGFAMLAGRLELRRGAAVILGCFLMIGAPAIARGILGLGREAAPGPVASVSSPAPAPAPVQPETRKVQQSADPYAGASLVR